MFSLKKFDLRPLPRGASKMKRKLCETDPVPGNATMREHTQCFAHGIAGIFEESALDSGKQKRSLRPGRTS
jgi:hypothetical protein